MKLNTKKIVASCFGLVITLLLSGQSFNWVASFGSAGNETGRSIVSDGSGNTYTTGWFTGTVDFDPGSGTLTKTSAGNEDVFLTKFNSNGSFVWCIALGAAGSDFGYEVTIDATSNLYITGRFVTTVDFDPGVGTTNLTSAGSGDVFVAKYSSSGSLLWAAAMGGSSNEYSNSIAVDAAGSVYTTGYYNGTADFNPGASVNNLVSTGSSEIFISKLDMNGNFLWAKSVGGSMQDEGKCVRVDNLSNVYLTGYFQGTADFDPGTGTHNVTALGLSGFRDCFVLKLDASGNYSWVAILAGTTDEEGSALCLDNNANVYTVGYFNATADFNPSGSTYNLTSYGSRDIFISKLTNAGVFAWAVQLGGTGDDTGYSIDLGPYNRVMVSGVYSTTADFDPSASSANITSVGGVDLFFAGYTSAGNYLFAKGLGSTWNDSYCAIYASSCDLYLTGQYQQSCDFDPGPGTAVRTSTGGYDVFIESFDQSFTNTMSAVACNVYNAPSGNTYTTSGTYLDTIPTSLGCDSVITINVTVNHATSSTYTATACNSYVWIDGNMYTSNNTTAQYYTVNSQGCDSIITLNLTIRHSSSSIANVTACDTYTWMNGVTYTANNNTAQYHLTNSVGCDSAITLNLILNHSSSSTDVITTCDSYTWMNGITYTSNNNTAQFHLTNASGCDSTIYLDLTINHPNSGIDVITACNSYTWIDGNTYTSNNNTGIYTLTNSAGCDSVVTLNLTVNSLDTSVTSMDPTLTSNSVGASYQWINCTTNTPIAGATGQSFTAITNGFYAVIVSIAGCPTDTSNCHQVLGTMVGQQMISGNLKVYPNPGTGVFLIEAGVSLEVPFRVYNEIGALLTSGSITEANKTVDLSSYADGIYFLEIQGHFLKLIKQN